MVPTGPLIRRRILIVLCVFLMLFLVLTVRLADLQILQAKALQQRAQAQWTSESIIYPTRGSILDRNGNVLAMSATAYIASVSPRQVTDPARFAQILAPILDMDEEVIRRKASDTSKGGVILKRQLPRDAAQQLKTMLAEQAESGNNALKGLYLEEDSRRYYPMGAFATQLIGLTTIDGVGQSGLESSLNDYLSGKNGRVLEEIDGKGRELSYSASEYVAAVNGSDVTLTIDQSIQSFAEKAAREALEVNNAKGVRVLAMNPQTGEILAMVNKPDFDLNDPPRNDVEQLTERLRNRLLTDAYEPGSTFKIITSAIALELGLTNPSEGFYCSGRITVDGSRIKCWGRPHGAETMAQALQNSCNPVFTELGLRIGLDNFYDYLERFGLTKLTGVDIDGEAGGIRIPRSNVKRVDLARIGFGQSVAVTPIQLLTAVCSVINGGELLKPYVVSSVRDESGEVWKLGERAVVNRTISEKTSATMRRLLQDVVELGGGKNARIEGYAVGGKTGTAQVYVDGVVSSETHIGSFIGFAPADDPAIAILFIVDEADVPVDYGSVTAAPYARQVLQQSLMYLGYAPKEAEVLVETSVPDVDGLNIAEAKKLLREAGLGWEVIGDGDTVTGQLPVSGAQMQQDSVVMIYTGGSEANGASVVENADDHSN